jgi:histidine triad (HIT) family protein
MLGAVPIRIPTPGHCSFCDYLARERPFTILEETALTAMLVTREQRGSVHVLVIPVAHRETVLDLDPAEAAALMDGVRRAAHAITTVHDPEGIAVWQNNGTPAHQSVPHVHFHVAATLPGGGTNWGEVPVLSFEQTDEIAGRLRPHLPAGAG